MRSEGGVGRFHSVGWLGGDGVGVEWGLGFEEMGYGDVEIKGGEVSYLVYRVACAYSVQA